MRRAAARGQRWARGVVVQQGDGSPTHAGGSLGQRSAHGWRWCLRRNGALTPRQWVVAFVVACVAVLAVAGLFAALGAVLVLPFAALELVVVVLAFAWMAHHAADREVLELDAETLHVERHCGRRCTHVRLPRTRVRVWPPQGGQTLVALQAGAQRVEVGQHVPPLLRRQLAQELQWTLALSGGVTPASGHSG